MGRRRAAGRRTGSEQAGGGSGGGALGARTVGYLHEHERMSRTLLITGASGRLGRHLASLALKAGWRVAGTFLAHPIQQQEVEAHTLDIRDRRAVIELLRTLRPHAVVHTAYRLSG